MNHINKVTAATAQLMSNTISCFNSTVTTKIPINDTSEIQFRNTNFYKITYVPMNVKKKKKNKY